jgi:hypothetical protein
VQVEAVEEVLQFFQQLHQQVVDKDKHIILIILLLFLEVLEVEDLH